MKTILLIIILSVLWVISSFHHVETAKKTSNTQIRELAGEELE